MFLPVNCPYTSAASYIRNPWITLFKFLYLRFFSGKKKFPSSCPNNNLNIQGRVNPETTKNVKSWPACSEICSQREDCNYWISAKKISTGTISTIVQLVQLNLLFFCTGPFTKHSYDCITMSDYGSTNADGNTVSGARDCQGG